MRPRIRTQAYLVGALPLAFLIVLLVLGLRVISISRAGGAFEQHSQHVLGTIERTRVELEGASRAATGAPAQSARRLAEARKRIDVQLRELKAEVAPDAGMPVAVAKLSRDLHAGLDLLDRYAKLAREKRANAARALASAQSTRALSMRLTADWDMSRARERRDELQKLTDLRLRARQYEIALVLACALGIVLTLLVAGRFGLGLARRLEHLAENARRLARGEEASPLLGNDEFSDLDLVYQAMMRQIAREQQLNSRLQRMLLPQQLPSFDGIRIDTSYVPAAQETEVGGDWYDAFAVSDRCICISIGDVAGHGLRAAAVMASVRPAVRTAARMQSDPGEIAAHLNRVVCADEPGTLVTAIVAMLDIEDGTLRYAVAGHPEPMVIRPDGETEMLPGRGMVFGADEHATYKTFESRLHEGWALLLYTDGLIEITKDYFAGVEELRRAASGEFASSAHNIAEAIQQRVFRGRRTDDDSAVLFVGVTRLGAGREHHRWTLDARDAESAHRAKRAILWHLGDAIRDEGQLAAIELVLGELIGNVARHSPGAADVAFERRDGQTLLRVTDRGKPFSYNGDGHAADLLAESGRGLFIVRSMARDLRVEHNGMGNVVTAVLPVS